jgi:hypothetical protein
MVSAHPRADFVVEQLHVLASVSVGSPTFVVSDDTVDELVADVYAPHAADWLQQPECVDGGEETVELLLAEDEEFDPDVQLDRNCELCADELRALVQDKELRIRGV